MCEKAFARVHMSLYEVRPVHTMMCTCKFECKYSNACLHAFHSAHVCVCVCVCVCARARACAYIRRVRYYIQASNLRASMHHRRILKLTHTLTDKCMRKAHVHIHAHRGAHPHAHAVVQLVVKSKVRIVVKSLVLLLVKRRVPKLY